MAWENTGFDPFLQGMIPPEFAGDVRGRVRPRPGATPSPVDGRQLGQAVGLDANGSPLPGTQSLFVPTDRSANSGSSPQQPKSRIEQIFDSVSIPSQPSPPMPVGAAGIAPASTQTPSRAGEMPRWLSDPYIPPAGVPEMAPMPARAPMPPVGPQPSLSTISPPAANGPPLGSFSGPYSPPPASAPSGGLPPPQFSTPQNQSLVSGRGAPASLFSGGSGAPPQTPAASPQAVAAPQPGPIPGTTGQALPASLFPNGPPPGYRRVLSGDGGAITQGDYYVPADPNYNPGLADVMARFPGMPPMQQWQLSQQLQQTAGQGMVDQVTSQNQIQGQNARLAGGVMTDSQRQGIGQYGVNPAAPGGIGAQGGAALLDAQARSRTNDIAAGRLAIDAAQTQIQASSWERRARFITDLQRNGTPLNEAISRAAEAERRGLFAGPTINTGMVPGLSASPSPLVQPPPAQPAAGGQQPQQQTPAQQPGNQLVTNPPPPPVTAQEPIYSALAAQIEGTRGFERPAPPQNGQTQQLEVGVGQFLSRLAREMPQLLASGPGGVVTPEVESNRRALRAYLETRFGPAAVAEAGRGVTQTTIGGVPLTTTPRNANLASFGVPAGQGVSYGLARTVLPRINPVGMWASLAAAVPTALDYGQSIWNGGPNEEQQGRALLANALAGRW